MKKYQYQIVRYVHDHFTGEFVNVGIVVYSKEERFLQCITIRKYQRITNMFPEVNGRWIVRILTQLQKELRAESNRLHDLFSLPDQISQITNGIISNDNNAIQFSEPAIGLDIDLEIAMNDLYKNLVEKYLAIPDDKTRLSDEEVWNQHYKQFFKKYGIESRLEMHEVQVPNDVISFERSWKNETWHSYEPLSFELKKKENIKEKVYKWAGKIQGLKHTSQKLHLSFLTSINPRHKDLMEFVLEYLEMNDDTLQIEVITEDKADEFAKEIKRKMESHDLQN